MCAGATHGAGAKSPGNQEILRRKRGLTTVLQLLGKAKGSLLRQVGKNTAVIDEWKTCDPYLMTDNEAVRVQIWRYAPELFAVKDTVDPVSLLCSFNGNQDERVHKCLESIKKEIETWKIEI